MSAQDQVYQAVKSGRLVRPKQCENCGAEGRIEGHHDDYDRPLDVRWLCRSCHATVHARKSKHVSFRLPPDMFAELQRLADRQHVEDDEWDLSKEIRRALKLYLARVKK